MKYYDTFRPTYIVPLVVPLWLTYDSSLQNYKQVPTICSFLTIINTQQLYKYQSSFV